MHRLHQNNFLSDFFHHFHILRNHRWRHWLLLHRWNSLNSLLALSSSLHQEIHHHPSIPPPSYPISSKSSLTGKTILPEVTFSAPFSLCQELSRFCRLPHLSSMIWLSSLMIIITEHLWLPSSNCPRRHLHIYWTNPYSSQVIIVTIIIIIANLKI